MGTHSPWLVRHLSMELPRPYMPRTNGLTYRDGGYWRGSLCCSLLHCARAGRVSSGWPRRLALAAVTAASSRAVRAAWHYRIQSAVPQLPARRRLARQQPAPMKKTRPFLWTSWVRAAVWPTRTPHRLPTLLTHCCLHAATWQQGLLAPRRRPRQRHGRRRHLAAGSSLVTLDGPWHQCFHCRAGRVMIQIIRPREQA